MKPYRTIPIAECGEPLVPIPPERFAFIEPHPYQSLGAPYGTFSPWWLRQGVLAALEQAQGALQKHRRGWKILLFDAWRPNAVQAFMVRREFEIMAREAGLNPDHVSKAEHDALMIKVYRVWAIPSEDPATPPLHSTGGAVDCTLADAEGCEVFMGSPIDENSERSNPDYFAAAEDVAGLAVHAHRQLLATIMRKAGFQPHHAEWWHFSKGDQYWAWREREGQGDGTVCAVYGRTVPSVSA